ncbi:MAG TPA: sigma 54-interacting transcriptional regulator [Terriglobales bacterium]
METSSSEHDFAAVAPAHELSAFEAVSPSMKAVEAMVRELAHSAVPVLLIGERGVGKHMIALRIHCASGGAPEAFQTAQAVEITTDSLAAAAQSCPVLYLDEICELNPECQEFLLRVPLQAEGNGSRHPWARIICGSSHDVEPYVRSGNFREDLYYRLSGVCLRIPPLRQRKEDIPHLMQFFLAKYSEEFRRPVPALSRETQDLLNEYSWPGNIPELEAAVRAIVAVGDETVAMGGLRAMLTRAEPKPNGEKISLKEAARAASREAEKELILKVLTRTRWNRRRAAQELQISYKALLYKLKQIGYGEYRAT